jgi:cytochrome P450
LGNRIAVAPTTIGGVSVPAGTYVTSCIGATNRDPSVVPDPDVLELRASRAGIWRSASGCLSVRA